MINIHCIANVFIIFREHIYVSKVLSELSVWQEAAIPGGLLGWILCVTFKKNLKIALLGGY
jgi:transcription initiation factor TFIIH subunit 4